MYFHVVILGVLNQFLSSIYWQPLRKLSFNVYLISCAITKIYFDTRDQKPHWNSDEIVRLSRANVKVGEGHS